MSNHMHFKMPVFILIIIAFVILIQVSKVEAAPPKCVLQLSNTSSSVSIASGGQISYSYQLKNIGKTNCRSTSLSAYYAGNESFDSSVPSASSRTNYYWEIGTLTKGATFNINITTKNLSDGNPIVSGEACASANGADDSCVETITNIVNTPNPVTPPITLTPTPTITPIPTITPAPTPSITPTPTPSITPPATLPSITKEYGIWFWDSPYAISWSENKRKIDEAKVHGFNAIYLTVDDRLTTGSSFLATYDTAVQQFISYANQQGIVVDAVSGWKDWAKPVNRYKPYAIMDYVAQYNSGHTAKFRQLQYDVEPYLLSTYETNKAVVLTEYIDFVYQLVARNTYGLGIQMVIPHFYGSQSTWTPKITYGNKTASTFTHLLAALDSKPNNSISVMSYRDTALGANGTLDITADEMQEIGQSGHSTKIIICQETGNVEPDYVTFYGSSKAVLQSQIDIINSTYAANSAFQGIGVHYIDPFLALP